MAVAAVEKVFTIVLYFSDCSSSRILALVMTRLKSLTDVMSFFSMASFNGS